MHYSPTKDLSRLFDPSVILASGGSSVKQVPPALVTCPLCKTDKLLIFASSDPQAAEGYWFNCLQCQWHGDTIELTAKLSNCNSLEVVIRNSITMGLIETPDLAAVNSAAIAAYIASYPQRRKQNEAIWAFFLNNLATDPQPDLLAHMGREHLRLSWGSMERKRFAPFVGATLKKDAGKILGCPLPDKGFYTSLVLNYQDVPGRTCAFEFCGEREKYLHFVAEERLNAEGGLAMLETIVPGEEIVYAVDNGLVALCTQRFHLNSNVKPLPIVAFNDSTVLAWQSLVAKKVIIWSLNPSWRLYKHARLIQNCYITRRPELKRGEEDVSRYLANNTVAYATGVMEKFALPWREDFINWITAPGNNSLEVRNALEELNLDYMEREHMLRVCPPDLKGRLTQVLGANVDAQRVVLKGKTVVEQADNWFILLHKQKKEIISDAIIKVTEEINDITRNQLEWIGVIRYKGQIIPFRDKFANIEANPADWLQKKVNQSGLGNPLIQRSWSANLPLLAKFFSNPSFQSTNCNIGLNSEGEIIFPRFRMYEGVVKEEAVLTRPDGMPALDVMPPTPKRPTEALWRATPAKAAFVALGAVYVANMLYRLKGEPVRQVAIVGEPNSVSRIACERFIQCAGIRQFILSSTRAEPIQKLLEDIRAFDYPAYVQFPPNFMGPKATLGNDDMWVPASPVEASGLGTIGRWIQLYAPQTCTDSHIGVYFDDILNYLLHLQTGGYVIESELPLEFAVLDDLCHWFGEHTGNAKEILALRNVARGMLYMPTPGDAMIDLAAWMHVGGKIAIDHTNFVAQLKADMPVDSGSSPVLVDDAAGMIYISRFAVHNSLTNLPTLRPDSELISQDFSSRGVLRMEGYSLEGWIVDKEHWDRRIKAWKDRVKKA